MKSKALRDSARGEVCTFQIVGVCNGNTDTTVLCHLPDESGGMGKKSDDFIAAYGCSSCHDVVDGRVRNSEYEEYRLFYNSRALVRTIRRLIDKGYVTFKGLK